MKNKLLPFVCVAGIIGCALLGAIIVARGHEVLAKHASEVTSSNVYRDPSGNFYIPMTLGAAKALCEHTRTDVRLAGNALDNTSVWPIRAPFIACMGDGELWVYTYDAKYEWVKATGENSPNLSTTVYVIFKGSPQD